MKVFACVNMFKPNYHVRSENHSTLCGVSVYRDIPDSFLRFCHVDKSDAWCPICREKFIEKYLSGLTFRWEIQDAAERMTEGG